MENSIKESSVKTVNPFTNEIVKQFDVMNDKELESKISKADAAFKTWKKRLLVLGPNYCIKWRLSCAIEKKN